VVEGGLAGQAGRRDAAAIARIPGVVRSFRNTTSWYNNASFLLPLLATFVVGLAGLVTRRAELLGFAVFLAAVTTAMTPVVLAAWRQTATSVVVTAGQLVSLHNGRVLKTIAWDAVTAVGQRETQGNLRWEIAAGDTDRMLLDGELDNLEELVRLIRAFSRLDRA
jgi:hypothetical protein